MKAIFSEIKEKLQSELAAIKLLIIRYGLCVDGNKLAENIEGYPENYRTKRSIKDIGIKDGCLVDREHRIVPWVPEEIFINVNGQESVVKTNFKPNALFHLVFENGRLLIKNPELGLEIPCRLSPQHEIFQQSINGFPIKQYIQVIGADRLAVLGYDGCSSWFEGTQCLFCDSCADRPGTRTARPSLNDLHVKFSDNITPWLNQYEQEYFTGLSKAYQCVLESKEFGPHFHLLLMAGNLMDMEPAWDYILRLAKTLSKIKPLSEIDSYLNMLPSPKVRFLEEAKDLGFKNLVTNLEVFGEKFYKAVCKGKQDLISYSLFLERMNDAVAIFGSGKIRCGFVLGAQPVEILKEGVRYLAERGIVSDYSVFTPKKGTPWMNRQQPDINEIADFTCFMANIYRKYDFKPLYCRMSSRSSIMNESFEVSIV